MTAIFGIKLAKGTAPILAAIFLSGCVTTYEDSTYSARPAPPYGVARGHYANFHDYGGPIFGFSGNIIFVPDNRYRYRIMGRRDEFLGFAYIEHDYRIRIVDPYGATLYWYYRRPDGHYHILDASYGHLGTLSPGHRHFANFNRFSKSRVRHFRRHEIDDDRRNIEREVRDRRERGNDRGPNRRQRKRDNDRTDRDRNDARSAPAATRRPAEVRKARQPAEVRNGRKPVIAPAQDTRSPEPARRNTRRVRDNDQPGQRARQNTNPAPAAVAPERRRGATPAAEDRRRDREQPRISAEPAPDRTPSARPSRPSRARSAPPVAQPRRAAPVGERPAVAAPADAAKAKANGKANGKADGKADGKEKATAKEKDAKAKAKDAKKENDRRRQRSGTDRKGEFKADEER